MLLGKKPHHGHGLVSLGHHSHGGGKPQHYSVGYGGGGLLGLIHQAIKPSYGNYNNPCGRPICQGEKDFKSFKNEGNVHTYKNQYDDKLPYQN